MTPASDSPTRPAAKPAGFRDTLNLPKTAFPMKANLVQNEPGSLSRWKNMDLYGRLRARGAQQPRGRWAFHDGPPYANGSIHLGHLLNKCLKDFVVRSRTMLGHDVPFVPGWDCHGLPIEHRVMQELAATPAKLAKLQGLPEDQRRMAVRRDCRQYAEKYVKLQAGQMQRLLTLADYDHPYLTMDPAFEAATLEVLAGLLEQGLVRRDLKPVHWSIANETALAEAELEYEERDDPSVYVEFEAADAGAVYDAFGLPPDPDAGDADSDEATDAAARPGQRPTFMIWTTTPWTLPANLAIAVHPRTEYALVRMDGTVTVVARGLVERVAKAVGCEDPAVLATAPGASLAGLRYEHPLVSAERGEGVASPSFRGAGPGAVFRVVTADYVTLEDGTGLVHTAPGHGTEDYQTGLREGLPIYCPVLADGRYDATAPEWLRGITVWDANRLVADRLRQSGHLAAEHRITHSYPHDWRGRTPVIFRCTEQWFVSVDRPTKRDGRSLRDLALAAVAAPAAGADPAVSFSPDWGRNRMRGMLEARPDWCISRQRAWGLPIPAFFWRDETGADRPFMTPASVRAVAAVVRGKGSDAWFTLPPAELLAGYDPAADPDAPAELKTGRVRPDDLRRGPDILDVWFESGSTWHAVMRERSGGRDYPVELYLEGADQHRGWFQTSLLPALGVTGTPPYRMLFTHGFTVDKDGRKMSKSLGNTLEVEDLLKQFGADVCRWWVASLATDNDMKADPAFLEAAGDGYRKVRNTLRFMLSNLDDLPAADAALPGDAPPTSIDARALAEFDRVRAAVVAAYEACDFRAAHGLVYGFCNEALSAVYFAAAKDRLYCDRPDSPRRRRTQRAMLTITDGLCRLLAPILPHTADEAYRSLWKAGADDSRCVHLLEFPPPTRVADDPAWARVMDAVPPALRALELAKSPAQSHAQSHAQAGGLGLDNPLDAGLVLPDPTGDLARFDANDLADLLGVSRVQLDPAAAEPRVLDLRGEPRCDRSWKRDGTVRVRSNGAALSDRDAEAIGVA